MVRFPVGTGSSHTKDFKNGSGPCLHGTYDEVGTTKHNWSARCQYNAVIVPEFLAMHDFHNSSSMSCLNHHTLMRDFNVNLSNKCEIFLFNV